MQNLKLCFQSLELKLGILDKASPSEEEVEGWHFRGVYLPGVHFDTTEDIGSYRLFVKRTFTL